MPGPTTRALHAAPAATLGQRPAAVPIVQAATFAFEDLDEFAAVSQAKTSGGYLYTRWGNPTVDAATATVAALEGAQACAGFASGMAAISTTMLTLGAGGHIVSASQLYGGTRSALQHVAARAGIDVRLADMSDPAGAAALCDEGTRMVYCETIGNPAMRVADLSAWAEIAHAAGAPLVVDATFTPPVLLRPLEHGADLVIHSSTKYLGGHSDHLGGVASGSAELVDRLRHAAIDLGGVMAPFEAFLLHRGLATLDLRLQRHSDNAMRVATWLAEHPRVASVRYPGLVDHPDHALAVSLLKDRFGGMLAIDVDGGADAGRAIMERVRVFGRAASLGGTKSLIVHPASVTHTQLNPDELAAAGMTPGTLRISIGIEDVEDLIADLDQALS